MSVDGPPRNANGSPSGGSAVAEFGNEAQTWGLTIASTGRPETRIGPPRGAAQRPNSADEAASVGVHMTRKTRPYLFYDTTSALCTTCLRTVEAKILLGDNAVYMDKWCPAHGTERVRVSDDVAYYRACRELFVKPPDLPRQFNTRMHYGCPYDCGLCPDHMQHSCLSIIEINEACNLACPICYAESGPHRTAHRTLDEVRRMLDAIVANEGEPDVVQISGGEPTLHPDLFAILDEAYARPIRHVMLNTNGVRIAREPGFVAELARRYPRLEIYLQFDSLEAAPLRALRGGDLREVRAAALNNLNALDMSTTLVVTLRKGLNDHEVGAIIRHALAQPCVRGVTLQPVQEAGRTEGYDRRAERLTVSEVRRLIAEQSEPVHCRGRRPGAVQSRHAGDGVCAEARRRCRSAHPSFRRADAGGRRRQHDRVRERGEHPRSRVRAVFH